ncbi:MAG TPA: hypothetical protein PLR37_11050 [Candidatus Accumulibacter phosphatis]|nr:hypothetical protein [Candidatus Accumulibacter phosphatis]
MTQRSIVVLGLPGSGKTTFLAALWHLVFSRETETKLRFDSLKSGNRKHLNAIAARWRKAQMQERTLLAGNQFVSINLVTEDSQAVTVTFPDIAGESYRQMWEERECEKVVADTLTQGSVLLFVHADDIKRPLWIMDVAAMALALDLPPDEVAQPVPWQPRLAPTQVQLVGLLSLLGAAPLDIGPRRLVVMLSAWDKAKGERLAPREFLRAKLPLLSQYLDTNPKLWQWTVYGVSAQGGEYDDTQPGAQPKQEAQDLRAADEPSRRIQLTDGVSTAHDLTVPLEWLMQ